MLSTSTCERVPMRVARPSTVPGSSMSLPAEDDGNEAHSVYTYCTSFLLRGEGLVGLELERLLQPLGDSLLVVGTDTQIKVHVHTDEPGTVLGLATRMGTLSQVELSLIHIS